MVTSNEFTGAIASGLLIATILWIYPNITTSVIGLSLRNPKLTVSQGVVYEAIVTFVLLITVCSCIDKKRSDLSGLSPLSGSFPLTIGFSVTIGCLFGVSLINHNGPFTRNDLANDFSLIYKIYMIYFENVGSIYGSLYESG